MVYLAAKGHNEITHREVQYYQPLILELMQHPKFRFSWSEEVRNGIIAATRTMFPHWFKR